MRGEREEPIADRCHHGAAHGGLAGICGPSGGNVSTGVFDLSAGDGFYEKPSGVPGLMDMVHLLVGLLRVMIRRLICGVGLLGLLYRQHILLVLIGLHRLLLLVTLLNLLLVLILLVHFCIAQGNLVEQS